MRRKITYDPDHDYYMILGVPAGADAAAIQRAYRQQAKKLHPDLNPTEAAKEGFQRLNEAYSVLSDPEARHLYDQLRWPYQTFPTPQPPAGTAYADEPASRSASPRPIYRPRPVYTAPAKPGIEPEAWLKARRLGWLAPVYRMAVDLLDSPYRYLLWLLAAAAAINVLLIVGGLLLASATSEEHRTTDSSSQSNSVQNPSRTIGNVIPSPTFVPTVTPVIPFVQDCGPYVEIFSPSYDTVITSNDSQLPLIGRIEHPDMFTFQVEVIPRDVRVAPFLLRPATTEKQPAVKYSALAWLDPLTKVVAGIYDIKLTVLDEGDRVLATCFTFIRKI